MYTCIHAGFQVLFFNYCITASRWYPDEKHDLTRDSFGSIGIGILPVDIYPVMPRFIRRVSGLAVYDDVIVFVAEFSFRVYF